MRFLSRGPLKHGQISSLFAFWNFLCTSQPLRRFMRPTTFPTPSSTMSSPLNVVFEDPQPHHCRDWATVLFFQSINSNGLAAAFIQFLSCKIKDLSTLCRHRKRRRQCQWNKCKLVPNSPKCKSVFSSCVSDTKIQLKCVV